jgi:hypothetical protein
VALLKVASKDGGFVTLSETPSSKGDRLSAGDVVMWVPYRYDETWTDKRLGWAGLIRAKIDWEWVDPKKNSFNYICHYD